MANLELRKSNLQHNLMDRTITHQVYQDMKGRVEKDYQTPRLQDKKSDVLRSSKKTHKVDFDLLCRLVPVTCLPARRRTKVATGLKSFNIT
jgi:hypothetical protein